LSATVPLNLEATARIAAAVFGCVATPILIVTAYLRWKRSTRALLPGWRNGLGMAAIAFVVTNWSVLTVNWILVSIPQGRGLYGIDWLGMLTGVTTLAAPLLALALQGAARLLAIAASVTVIAFGHSFIYN
jgi:hypothetical protein